MDTTDATQLNVKPKNSPITSSYAGQTQIPRLDRNLGLIRIMHSASHHGMSLSRSISGGLANYPLDACGLLGKRALPGDDQPGEGVDDQGGVAKAHRYPNVGEVGKVGLVRFEVQEVPLDEIGD